VTGQADGTSELGQMQQAAGHIRCPGTCCRIRSGFSTTPKDLRPRSRQDPGRRCILTRATCRCIKHLPSRRRQRQCTAMFVVSKGEFSVPGHPRSSLACLDRLPAGRCRAVLPPTHLRKISCGCSMLAHSATGSLAPRMLRCSQGLWRGHAQRGFGQSPRTRTACGVSRRRSAVVRGRKPGIVRRSALLQSGQIDTGSASPVPAVPTPAGEDLSDS
jgi:hypothetical protein